MFTRRHIKHSRLLLRHARKYLRYKDDLLSGSNREEIVAGMKNLRDALRQKERERIHSTAVTLYSALPSVTPVPWILYCAYSRKGTRMSLMIAPRILHYLRHA